MAGFKALHGESVIPDGCYCYDNGRIVDKKDGSMPVMHVNLCPYWDLDETKPKQMNGYCWFMEMGDGDGGGLLWDQCKECGINEDWAEE